MSNSLAWGTYRPLQEIRTMKSLNHPHIVKLYEFICTVYTVFIVMEHASRGNIFSVLAVCRSPRPRASSHSSFRPLNIVIRRASYRGTASQGTSFWMKNWTLNWQTSALAVVTLAASCVISVAAFLTSPQRSVCYKSQSSLPFKLYHCSTMSSCVLWHDVVSDHFDHVSML